MSVEVVFLDTEPGEPRQIEILETADGEWRKFTEHPADDSEPITDEWLESVGFYLPVGGRFLTIEVDAVTYMYVRPDVGSWQLIDHDPEDDQAGSVWIQKPFTRGDVRRLFAALGIELEEEAKNER